MTEAQNQALREATDILRLNFDNYILTTRAVLEDGKSDATLTYWHGPMPTILGLLQLAQMRVSHVAMNGISPDGNR